MGKGTSNAQVHTGRSHPSVHWCFTDFGLVVSSQLFHRILIVKCSITSILTGATTNNSLFLARQTFLKQRAWLCLRPRKMIKWEHFGDQVRGLFAVTIVVLFNAHECPGSISLASAFFTSFQFQIQRSGGDGADGFAFVIQVFLFAFWISPTGNTEMIFHPC